MNSPASLLEKLSRAKIGFFLLIFKIYTDTFPCNKLINFYQIEVSNTAVFLDLGRIMKLEAVG